MANKQILTTADMLEMVEDEAFWIDMEKVDVFITPPEDGIASEEDSEDEESGSNINHLSGRQLQAHAAATVKSKSKDNVYFDEEFDEEDNIPLAALKTNGKSRKPAERNWSKGKDLQYIFPQFVSPKIDQIIPKDPVDCFELFFDSEITEFLVKMFIVYAKSKGDHNFQMTVEDLKCYVGILLLSGYIDIPRWRMLWECDTETYNPSVASAMRRNRFEEIKKYTHCSDNDNLAESDKFGKVRPLFDLLNLRFLKYAEMGENLSIDESMVPYFGRHSAKQFIRGKPIRYGYKMWCLCEPLGYLIQFEPYQGKELNRKNMDLGVGGSVVVNLLTKLPKQVPFKVYADRYFSSLKLVNHLKNMGYGYTGTIMANRVEKCPISNIKTFQKMERGSYEYYTDTNSSVTITAWNDNRVVLTVSSCDGIEPVDQANRWITSAKKKLPVKQSYVISQYNKYMGGVDRMDENIDRYRISMRSKKWWWQPFAFCLDTCAHNAWQIYRKSVNNTVDYLKFRRIIVQAYLKKYGQPVLGGGRPKSSKQIYSRVPEAIRYDRYDHWIQTSAKQNRCALCNKNSTKSCEKCGVNLHESCFKLFHIR